ncbi:MAG: transketolase family protein, partial [Eubacterium sp.]|nr:transketolase family protein [Eubacterium sp.]
MTDTTKLSTAECYGIALCELGEEHKDVVALTADLAKSTKIGMFGEQFPERFFNVGIAEQNLFGVAAGMAKNGLVPFASTFAIFTAARSLDQIHTDICYQNVPVKIIATHAGTSFG